MGINDETPSWYVLLFAAMAAAALYAGAWVAAVIFFAVQPSSPFRQYHPAMLILVFIIMWSTAVVWYHIIYLLKYRGISRGKERDLDNVRIIGGSFIFWLFYGIYKIMVFSLKYILAPRLPIIVILDGIRTIPGIGYTLAFIILLAMFFPIVIIVVHIVKERRAELKIAVEAKTRPDNSDINL